LYFDFFDPQLLESILKLCGLFFPNLVSIVIFMLQ